MSFAPFAVMKDRFHNFIYIEISAGTQQCIGPKYAGPLGILQALGDGTKFLFKENLLPSRGDTRLFSIGPSIAVISILLSYSVIPFRYCLVLANLNISVFLWIAISSIAPVGLLMSRYGSNNKYSFLGGLRDAAQSISSSGSKATSNELSSNRKRFRSFFSLWKS